MQTVLSRAGRWPLALTLAALCACTDGPSAPKRSPERDRAAAQPINITKVDFSVGRSARTADDVSAAAEAISTGKDSR